MGNITKLSFDPRLGRAGTYMPATTVEGQRIAVLRCPHGHIFPLRGHHIGGSDGIVSPDVRCTMPGCTWRAYVTLEGWQDAITAMDTAPTP